MSFDGRGTGWSSPFWPPNSSGSIWDPSSLDDDEEAYYDDEEAYYDDEEEEIFDMIDNTPEYKDTVVDGLPIKKIIQERGSGQNYMGTRKIPKYIDSQKIRESTDTKFLELLDAGRFFPKQKEQDVSRNYWGDVAKALEEVVETEAYEKLGNTPAQRAQKYYEQVGKHVKEQRDKKKKENQEKKDREEKKSGKGKNKPGNKEGKGKGQGEKHDEGKPSGKKSNKIEYSEEETALPYDKEDLKQVDKEVLKKLLKVVDLKTYSSSTTEKDLFEDQQGEIEISERLVKASDLKLLPIRELIGPMFDYKFCSGQLEITKRYSSISRKKAAIILFDRSGSMYDPEKIAYLRAILTKYALELNEDFCFYLSSFISEPDEWFYFDHTNKKEAIKMFQTIYPKGGGTTKVYEALKKCMDMVSMGHLINSAVHSVPGKPNGIKMKSGLDISYVVINDGDDPISSTYIDKQTHALILGQKNEALKKLCESSGGSYNEIYIQ